MVTLLADTVMPPVMFLALTTWPAVVTLMLPLADRTVPAGMPVLAAIGLAAGKAGEVVQASAVGVLEGTGIGVGVAAAANVTTLPPEDPVIDATTTPAEGVPDSASKATSGPAAQVRTAT